MIDTDPPIASIGPLTDTGASTWVAIEELTTRVPPERWAVVGGQMVAIHAALAGMDAPRVTDDGDIVVDVRGHGRDAMRTVAEALTAIDFTVTASPDGVTRFERGRAKIDLLAPEGIGRNVETVPPGYAVQAPGTSQALSRTIYVAVDWGSGSTTIRCPSLLGAVIAKAAASSEIISLPADGRLKHQIDLVFLLSVASTLPIDDLERAAAEMTRTDRRRLSTATAAILDDPLHRARSAAADFGDVADAIELLLVATR